MNQTPNRRSLLARSAIMFSTALLCVALPSLTAHAKEKVARNIVAIGGSVTEIIYALGEEERLIARDSTSLYPEATSDLPDVGYIRALSPEGVLSVNPDMIIALEGAGPPEAVAILKQAGIPFREIPEGNDKEAIITKIKATAEALGVDSGGKELVEKVAGDLDRILADAERIQAKRRVLFVLSMQGGRILASGKDTNADAIIRLAGGENALTGLTGYKPISNEAVIEARPDVILMMNRTGDHAIATDELFSHPAFALTPAAQSQSMVRMDGLYLLGFGPRTADAAKDLSNALYPAVQASGN